jgi:methionine-rich copper-binding protein CopC
MKNHLASCLTPRLIIGLLAAFPAGAFAHAHLESAQPANGSVNASSPAQVVLRFSEPVALLDLTLEKAGSPARKLGPLPRDAASSLSVPLPKLADGAYALRYHGVSDDTHETKGTLRFRVGPGAKAAEKPQGPKHD